MKPHLVLPLLLAGLVLVLPSASAVDPTAPNSFRFAEATIDQLQEQIPHRAQTVFPRRCDRCRAAGVVLLPQDLRLTL